MNSLRGSAIVIALLAVSALMTVVLSIARLVPKDFRSALAFESSINAENAAWAGVEHGLLLLREHPYYEVSLQDPPNASEQIQANDYPHGSYPAPIKRGVGDCDVERIKPECKGFDRQLGIPVNATPVQFGTMLGAHTTETYSLAIWHRRENVGNMRSKKPDPLDDNLPPQQNQFQNAANINPSLSKDEERTLDIRGDSSLTLTWKPIITTTTPGCSNDGTQFQLVYTIRNTLGDIIPSDGRNILDMSNLQKTWILPQDVSTLSLRFLATNPNESSIASCFIRYSLKNAPGETADLGFDVIDSVGESGGVRRKIRVLVDRHNGKVLNIFDFGVACPTCQL